MRLPLALLVLALPACQSRPVDEAGTTEEPEIAVSATRDIRALPTSEVTVGAAGASGSAVGGTTSTATTTAVQSSNVAVQRVFSEFNARQTAGGLLLTLPESVLFDFDASALRSDAEQALAKIRTVLAEYPDAPVEIIGHTDAKGADDYNQTLSERRAAAVVAWLSGNSVSAARLTATGRGEAEPVAPNARPDGADDPDGRQRNRRVEILLRGVSTSGSPAAGGPTSTIRTSPADSTR